jgi:hypothetical protein
MAGTKRPLNKLKSGEGGTKEPYLSLLLDLQRIAETGEKGNFITLHSAILLDAFLGPLRSFFSEDELVLYREMKDSLSKS